MTRHATWSGSAYSHLLDRLLRVMASHFFHDLACGHKTLLLLEIVQFENYVLKGTMDELVKNKWCALKRTSESRTSLCPTNVLNKFFVYQVPRVLCQINVLCLLNLLCPSINKISLSNK